MNQAVATFAAQLKSYNDRDQAAIDGITGDEERSAALIKQLQESQGAWTPEDQAALDELEALSKAKTEKLEALDNNLPPPVPAVP